MAIRSRTGNSHLNQFEAIRRPPLLLAGGFLFLR
jgi:hypothetical protein